MRGYSILKHFAYATATSIVLSSGVGAAKAQNLPAYMQPIAGLTASSPSETAQAKAPGFQGYRFEPPVPGVQEDWLAIVRFDTEMNLQAWLDSPERHKLLQEASGFTKEFHARIARTGFDQWFPAAAAGAAPPAAWKQNMLVLLMLYPIVFLFGLLVQTPLLTRAAGLPFAIALFIGNVASVILLSRLLPWMSTRFSWWLQPAGSNPARTERIGTGFVIALYGLMLIGFWGLS